MDRFDTSEDKDQNAFAEWCELVCDQYPEEFDSPYFSEWEAEMLQVLYANMFFPNQAATVIICGWKIISHLI